MSKSFVSTDNSNHVGKTNVWLTPRSILDKLGDFDLDPCAAKNWPTAKNHYYEKGLEKNWFGRVWLNPPYGKNINLWLEKLQNHGNGLALVFVRSDTKWFQNLEFDAINLMAGRIKFLQSDLTSKTNAGTPSCLIAFGKENVNALKYIKGKILFG